MESTSTTTSTKSTDFAVDIGIWGASQRSSPEEQGQGAWNIQPRTTSPAFHRFPDPILHFSRSRLPAGGHPSPLPLGRPLPTPSPTAGTVCNARLGRWSLGPKEPMLSSVPFLAWFFSPRDSSSSLVPFLPLPLPLPQIKETHTSPLSTPQCMTVGHGCTASVSLGGKGSPRPLLCPGRGQRGTDWATGETSTPDSTPDQIRFRVVSR